MCNFLHTIRNSELVNQNVHFAMYFLHTIRNSELVNQNVYFAVLLHSGVTFYTHYLIPNGSVSGRVILYALVI